MKGMDKPLVKRVLTASLLATLVLLPGCLLLHRGRTDLATPVNPGDQPDKILYEKATNEIQHGRFDVGRLTLQTLINTYPDSEYLAKAKLAIADSYYSEGGVSGFTQAEAEYRDFITFFPTAPEAPEAQYRVGMAHYRLMAKADRDETEAKLAEAEFKEFLLKYPDSPMMPRVKRRLRETQEVLAQGEYKIANFYYMRGANRAARSRFQDIVEKYPSFSRGDVALYYLGQTLERLKAPQTAAPYYADIVTNFPLSPLVDDAKARLTALHQPVPRPTRAVLARAQADAIHHARRDPLARLGGMMSSSPDTSATLHGPVRLGGAPAPGAEVAKTSPSVTPPASATIVAQPVGDASLSAGKAVDPRSAGTSAASQGSNPKEEAGSGAPPEENPSGVPTPPKKKGRLRVFKKLIKPF
jgi:outer membrane protein assembly factor BamD